MTVSKSDVIDFVAIPPGSPNMVHLVVIDDLPWDPLESHLALLRAKLNTYIHVLVSGQLKQFVSMPLPPNPEIKLLVVVAHASPAEATPFFDQVRAVLVGMGAAFEVLSVADFEARVRQTR